MTWLLFIGLSLVAANASAFESSLGINTEAPQAESDIAGQAMPFADIFRTARPFEELSTGITVDENGWPTSIASGGQARTKLLQAVPEGALPAGDYFVLYEGAGNIGFTGHNIAISPLPLNLRNEGFLGRTLKINADSNELTVVTSGITEGEGNYIKNIRIIMPGGVCGDLVTQRVDSNAECPVDKTYQSFVDKLKNNRNAIVFNPDYLDFLKDFRVIRMMNLMEASPGISSCKNALGILVEECVMHETTWADRATLSDAVWGGSSRTGLSERADVTNAKEHKGVPVEVLVELANQLNVSPWFNMPHAADNDYVSQLSSYINDNLNTNLKVYIEYSNEVWNSGFIGFHYVQQKGIDAGFNTVPDVFDGTLRDQNYFARLRYYSKRSVELFDLWEIAFLGANRLVRVVGTSQGDTVLSEKILSYENAVSNGKIDALAMAPYFFGCVDRTSSCSSAPKILSEVTSADDVFDVIDQDFSVDPLGMQGALEKINRQAIIADANNIQLLAYEGGQHLTIMGSMGSLSESAKEDLRDIFKQANRDDRMKARYQTLLNAWKAEADKGATLFTLYTLPQSYYRYGNWGLKEHLNKPREESPKYDAVMTFQETVLEPWWEYDSDNDGLSNETEVPNASGVEVGDGDGDGTLDSAQVDVTSLKNHDDTNWLTYRNNSNASQSNFITIAAPQTVPANKHLLHGLIQYDIAVASGATITIEVYVDKNTAIQDYFLLGNDGEWLAQNATITHESNKTKLVFTVTEGENFDRDAIVNGVLQLAQGGVTVNTGFDVWPYAYRYGNVELNSPTPTKTFTVKNTGSGELSISSIDLVGNTPNEFIITTDGCTGQSLAANATCTVDASFQPTTMGTKSALLQISTNDPDNATASIFLSNNEALEQEAERRLPPVLNSLEIPENMTAGQTYTLSWSVLGYHNDYDTWIVFFDCAGITENCGSSFGTNFEVSPRISPTVVEDGDWSYKGRKSRVHHYSYDFTPSTDRFDEAKPIVIRFYRKNGKDNFVGNSALSLIIPGNHSENYYDTTGRRIQKMISP